MTDPRSDGGTVVDSAERASARPTADAETDGATGGLTARLPPSARRVGSLAATEVRLGLRRRWAIVLAGLFAAFGMLVLTFAGSAAGPAGYRRIAASLATLCVYVVPLAALAYGYDAVVGPAESGWLEVLSALPVTRLGLLAGVTLGRAVTLAGGVLLGFAIPAGILTSEYGLATLPSTVAVLLGATGLGLAFLAVAVLVSTVARERTHALGGALLAWVWFVLVHDLLALGVVAAFDLPDGAVTAAVLANPTAVYRVLVLDLLGAGGAGGFGSVTAAAGLSAGPLALALAAWIAAPLAAAAVIVRCRGAVSAA
ncbi:ABC transporter permease [Halomicrobium salinisoli]|uniref:ABC transporter permease n=1 Tax=Halomicrobium salinisoli TaxID=2878391 RepID=UPI001CF0BAEB|nr:ABC transporter permease subunit [Halomicrobium salinisoli]